MSKATYPANRMNAASEPLTDWTVKMNVGDIVERADRDYLRSGGEAYSAAVVVQTKPLILVSFGTDMRWESTVQDVTFSVVGQATEAQLTACMRRI